MPIAKQPDAWGELDEHLFTKYYPGPVYAYLAVATMRGSRVGGERISPVFGEPTFADMYVKK